MIFHLNYRAYKIGLGVRMFNVHRTGKKVTSLSQDSILGTIALSYRLVITTVFDTRGYSVRREFA